MLGECEPLPSFPFLPALSQTLFLSWHSAAISLSPLLAFWKPDILCKTRIFQSKYCCYSVTQLCPALCEPMDCSTPGFLVLHYLPSSLKFISIESMMPSNHLIHYRPLLFLLSIFPSIRVFFNESDLCIRWPKYWNFNFSISPSNEESGLISFRIDWFDLLAVQGTLKSLLQHLSSKAPILWHSAFFMVQLSNSYMTTGKTIALMRQTSLLAKWCLCFLVRCLGLS